VESWHRLLKTSYLKPPEHLRIDDVVQILTNEVESHYRWSQNQVKSGFSGQTSNKFQMRQKLMADAFTRNDMEMLGIVLTAFPGRVRFSLSS
jgi:hypothetical protein